MSKMLFAWFLMALAVAYLVSGNSEESVTCVVGAILLIHMPGQKP